MDIIKNLLENGYKIIPIQSGEKRPHKKIKNIKEFLAKNLNFIEVQQLFKTDTYAIMLGKEFGGICVLDIDNKNCISSDLNFKFLNKLRKRNNELFEKLYIETTQTNGIHLIFKVNFDITEKQKLAQNKESKTLIEVLYHDYVLISPSPNYEVVQNDLLSLPQISKRDFKYLIRLAKSFNEKIQKNISDLKKNKKKNDVCL